MQGANLALLLRLVRTHASRTRSHTLTQMVSPLQLPCVQVCERRTLRPSSLTSLTSGRRTRSCIGIMTCCGWGPVLLLPLPPLLLAAPPLPSDGAICKANAGWRALTHSRARALGGVNGYADGDAQPMRVWWLRVARACAHACVDARTCARHVARKRLPLSAVLLAIWRLGLQGWAPPHARLLVAEEVGILTSVQSPPSHSRTPEPETLNTCDE